MSTAKYFEEWTERARQLFSNQTIGELNSAQLALHAAGGDIPLANVSGALMVALNEEYKKFAAINTGESDIGLLAWRSRNLLEISLWITSSLSSPHHARRFFEDAFKDSQDLVKAFSAFGEKMDLGTSWLADIEAVRHRVSANAANFGILESDEPYLRMSSIAAELNFAEPFKVYWKLLSKFAHPTAMRVIGAADTHALSHQFKVFNGMGSMFYVHAIEALRAFYSATCPKNAEC